MNNVLRPLFKNIRQIREKNLKRYTNKTNRLAVEFILRFSRIKLLLLLCFSGKIHVPRSCVLVFSARKRWTNTRNRLNRTTVRGLTFAGRNSRNHSIKYEVPPKNRSKTCVTSHARYQREVMNFKKKIIYVNRRRLGGRAWPFLVRTKIF